MSDFMVQLWRDAMSSDVDPASYWPELDKHVIIQLRETGEIRSAVTTSISYTKPDGERQVVAPVFIDTCDFELRIYTLEQVQSWGESGVNQTVH